MKSTNGGIGFDDDGFDDEMFYDKDGMFRKRVVDWPEVRRYVEQKRNVTLSVNPHYSNPLYSRGGTQLVFGVEKYPGVERVNWEYSDRLWQWDWDKSQAAYETAKQSKCVQHSAKYYKTYLTAYYGKPVYLFGILAGVNVSNGYPYQVFGFTFPDEVK